jgi:hypothetical protein
MRSQAFPTIVLAFAALVAPAWASSPDEKSYDQNTIAALESRIGQAPQREQCFLYAELIHEMTEFSLKQYAAGDVDQASALLKQVQQIVLKMHLSVTDNDKRLKNAEILLRHSAFRLKEMLRSTNSEDRPLVEATLAQVNQAESETMLQVFRK